MSHLRLKFLPSVRPSTHTTRKKHVKGRVMVTVRVVFSQLPKWLRSLSSSAKFYSWSRKSLTRVSLDQSETKQKAIVTWLIPAFPRLALVAYFLVSMSSRSWRGFHLLTLVASFPTLGTDHKFSRAWHELHAVTKSDWFTAMFTTVLIGYWDSTT